MGENWTWAIENAEIDKLGYKRYGASWKNWRGPDFSDWTNSRWRDVVNDRPAVCGIMEEIHDRKLDEAEPAQLAVRHDLRDGKLLAFTSGPTGMSANAIEASKWDGTLADDWLLTGYKDGQEIRIISDNEASVPDGKFAKACMEAASTRKPDSVERKFLEWFAQNYPDEPPKHTGTGDFFERVRVSAIGSLSAAKRALRSARTIFEGSES